MNPRPPYTMTQLASEIVAVDPSAKMEYANADGLGVYQELRAINDNPERLAEALRQVRRYDQRIVEVSLDDGVVVVRITAAGGRWTRTTFALEAMWSALEEAPPPKKRTRKKAVPDTTE